MYHGGREGGSSVYYYIPGVGKRYPGDELTKLYNKYDTIVMAINIAMSNLTTSCYTRVYVCVAVCW